MASSLAAAETVASETERELGVAVADIGAGTIDLALFADGSPLYSAVLPVGGNNVTNDVAIGLKTSLQVAEELKIRHGTCDLRGLEEDENIAVSVLGEDAGREVSRLEMCQIIEARMRETFELMRDRMRESGHGMLPAGLILTGGGVAARRRGRARPRGPPDAGPDRLAGGHRRAWSTVSSPRRSATRSGCSCGAPASSRPGSRHATSRLRRWAGWAASGTPCGASSPRRGRLRRASRPAARRTFRFRYAPHPNDGGPPTLDHGAILPGRRRDPRDRVARFAEHARGSRER